MNLYGIVEFIGAAVFAYILIKTVFWIVTRFYVYGPLSKPVDFSKFGNWSVVTGGTGNFS